MGTLYGKELGMQSYDDFLEYALQHSFGDIHFKIDPQTGMKAIIAIHNTKLGPALGGCRFISYTHPTQAIFDAMRLARGMSYKSALANLPLGGGKSVILKPEGEFDRTTYFKQFGRFVQELNGRYITALDSGTELSDMDIINQETPYVASLSRYNGDPAPYTAQGVLRGIQAAVMFKLGKDNLHDLHIAVQGMGHVGYTLAKQLHQLGARLSIADINPMIVEKISTECNATIVAPNEIHKIACDVFSPCALGAIINDQSLKEFQTSIIAGAANNQLEHTYHGQQLHNQGILYAPDYVINAGGVIFAASKYLNTPAEQVDQKINDIYDSLMQIYARSTKENHPTSEIADIMAQEILGISK